MSIDAVETTDQVAALAAQVETLMAQLAEQKAKADKAEADAQKAKDDAKKAQEEAQKAEKVRKYTRIELGTKALLTSATLNEAIQKADAAFAAQPKGRADEHEAKQDVLRALRVLSLAEVGLVSEKNGTITVIGKVVAPNAVVTVPELPKTGTES